MSEFDTMDYNQYIQHLETNKVEYTITELDQIVSVITDDGFKRKFNFKNEQI